MGLKIWLELAGCCNQSESEFFYRRVPLLCVTKCPAGVVHRLLHLVLFFYQGRTDDSGGYSQVEEQFFFWF